MLGNPLNRSPTARSSSITKQQLHQFGSVVLAFVMGLMVANRWNTPSPVLVPSVSTTGTSSPSAVTDAPAPASAGGLLTLKEMRERWRLPCNYVHDGYYLTDSNSVLHQVHQTLTEDESLQEDDIPIMVEVGGHDGITKSISLKCSVCLHINALLIEATPSTYKTLKGARAYDHTVHAALCEEGQQSITMIENKQNSGQNQVGGTDKDGQGQQVPCTTLDKELDKLVQTYNVPRDKLKLIFLVMDVEGHEHIAIKGLMNYSPIKAMIEVQSQGSHKEQFDAWYKHHNLVIGKCGGDIHKLDQCTNFHTPTLQDAMHMELTKTLLYGARKQHPKNTHQTRLVAPNYLFYGE